MIVKKSQALLLILILLVFIGLLLSIASFLLKTHSEIWFIQEKGTIAFYLACAGLERAKIEAKNGVLTAPLWSGPYFLEGGRYYFYIESIGANRRLLRAIGQTLDNSGRVIAEREVEVRVQNVFVKPQEMNFSWREI